MFLILTQWGNLGIPDLLPLYVPNFKLKFRYAIIPGISISSHLRGPFLKEIEMLPYI